MNDDEITKNAWDKQDWETDKSYRYFQKFYLLQAPPRTLTNAYRRYLIEVRGRTVEEVDKTYPSGIWQKWAHAKKHRSHDLVHPDALTWSQRADLYDKHVADTSSEKILENRRDLVKTEKADAESQLKLWNVLFTSLTEFIDYKIEQAKKDGGRFDPIPYINRSKDLFRWREEIAAFARRSLMLPSTIKEDRYGDAEEEPLKVKWHEPEFEDNDIGIGMSEVVEAMRGRYGQGADEED